MMAAVFSNATGTATVVRPKRPESPILDPVVLLLALALSVQFPAVFAVARTQCIELKSGWNVLLLEVDSAETDPARVFGDLSVDVAASYFQNATPVQFIKELEAVPWDEPVWGIWHSAIRHRSTSSRGVEINLRST